MANDHVNYGFIGNVDGCQLGEGLLIQAGIGAMGYPMASRLRSKMHKESTLVVYDVNSEPCNRLKEALKTIGPVVVAGSIKEVVESSVRTPLSSIILTFLGYHSQHCNCCK